MAFPFQLAALGGTFDHLHAGHHHLIKSALQSAARLIIGLVVTPRLKEFPATIQSFETRRQALIDFLTGHHYHSRVEIIPLNDAFGPTLSHPQIDLVVVSQLTQPGALLINKKRQALGLSPLKIQVVSMLCTPDNLPIASSRIRAGEIDRQGQIYLDSFTRDWHLSSQGRQELSAPQGKLLLGLSPQLLHSEWVVLVGDRVVQEFYERKLAFSHALIDGHIERQPVTPPPDNYGCRDYYCLDNPAGTINASAVRKLAALASQPSQLIFIKGEEDLLVLPVGLTYPLGTQIFYGQPQKGAVMIEITEAVKQRLLVQLNTLFRS